MLSRGIPQLDGITAPSSVQRFWDVLPFIRASGTDNGTLRLPRGVTFLGDPKLPKLLFLRPKVYPLLFNLVKRLKRTGTEGLVLTGTPGIGKTYFLYYLLWLLAAAMAAGKKSAPSCIVFERQTKEPSCRYLFSANAPVRMGSQSDFISELADVKCWYAVAGTSAAFPSNDCPTLIHVRPACSTTRA